MEILKSSLKQVPEADRVKGRVYGVSDDLNGGLEISAIFNYGNKSATNTHWKHWFELPESMLPVREVEVMPEVGKDYEFGSTSFKGFRGRLTYFEFELKGGTTVKTDNIRPISTNPAQSLTIPAGTKADQLEFLRGVIATMEGGGV
jgi:hypothetical protein